MEQISPSAVVLIDINKVHRLMRVLVFEPNTMLQVMVRETLRDVGIETCVTCNSEITDRLLTTGDWDGLLSSLTYPGLDLATKAAACGIRSVIMSGRLDRRAEVETNGVWFLGKPFSIAQLLAALAFEPFVGVTPLAAQPPAATQARSLLPPFVVGNECKLDQHKRKPRRYVMTFRSPGKPSRHFCAFERP
jgi:hypothetical protein